jgi:hypothetical protein
MDVPQCVIQIVFIISINMGNAVGIPVDINLLPDGIVGVRGLIIREWAIKRPVDGQATDPDNQDE